MTRLSLAIIALSGLLLAACNASGANSNVVAVFSNANASTSGRTARFLPRGAWDLQYSWNCRRATSEGISGTRGIDLTVYNSDDDTTAFEHPETRSGNFAGKGTLHFQRPGDYYLGVQTICDWTASIVDRS